MPAKPGADASLPIEDFAPIGDCRSAALFGTPANGRWCSAPEKAGAGITRRYIGDTMVLETLFATAGGTLDPGRNAFIQSFGSPALDASLPLMLRLDSLPPDDPRIVGTVAAVEEDLLVDGFVLRHRTEDADGLPAGKGAFLPCTFRLATAYERGSPRRAKRPPRAAAGARQRRRPARRGVRSCGTAPGRHLSASLLAPRADRDGVGP